MDRQTLPVITGQRIKKRREELGYTQIELAEAVGKTQNQISMYERGKALPSVDGLFSIAEFLETTPDSLLGFDGLSENEQRLLELYRSKSPEIQRKLVEIARVV